VSIASLGASVGGIIGAPALLFGITRIGFASTTIVAGVFAITVVLPLVALVLRNRPQDLGLFPDGFPLGPGATTIDTPNWTLPMALSTAALRSVMATFGIGMMVKICGRRGRYTGPITPAETAWIPVDADAGA
jgi:hypothetical protein